MAPNLLLFSEKQTIFPFQIEIIFHRHDNPKSYSFILHSFYLNRKFIFLNTSEMNEYNGQKCETKFLILLYYWVEIIRMKNSSESPFIYFTNVSTWSKNDPRNLQILELIIKLFFDSIQLWYQFLTMTKNKIIINDQKSNNYLSKLSMSLYFQSVSRTSTIYSMFYLVELREHFKNRKKYI